MLIFLQISKNSSKNKKQCESLVGIGHSLLKSYLHMKYTNATSIVEYILPTTEGGKAEKLQQSANDK